MIIEAIGAPIYQIAESCSFRDRLPGLGGEKNKTLSAAIPSVRHLAGGEPYIHYTYTEANKQCRVRASMISVSYK